MTSRNKRFRVINYLDIAPLIDCMLLLLIFFLLTSSFIQEDKGFNVNLPKAAYAGQLNEKSLNVYLNSKGEVFLNDKKTTFSALKAFFLKSDKNVNIKADKDVRLEKVTKIMDLARSCNIQNLSIATINE